MALEILTVTFTLYPSTANGKNTIGGVVLEDYSEIFTKLNLLCTSPYPKAVLIRIRTADAAA